MSETLPPKPPIDKENWQQFVIEHMPYARKLGLSYALKNHKYVDECIAEAYFLLVAYALKYTVKAVDANWDLLIDLRTFIRRRLQDYFKYQRFITITDLFARHTAIAAKDAMPWYASLLIYEPQVQHIQELLTGLAENERELSILIMKADGYNGLEIAEALDLDVVNVRRTLTRIHARLSVRMANLNEDD